MHVRVLSPILNMHSIKVLFVCFQLFSMLSSCDSKHLLSLSSNFSRVVGTGILPTTYFVMSCSYFSASWSQDEQYFKIKNLNKIILTKEQHFLVV